MEFPLTGCMIATLEPLSVLRPQSCKTEAQPRRLSWKASSPWRESSEGAVQVAPTLATGS